MANKMLEIGVSTGLVLLMVGLMLLVEIAAPEGMRSPGFVMIVLLFIISMGFAGVKLTQGGRQI